MAPDMQEVGEAVEDRDRAGGRPEEGCRVVHGVWEGEAE